VEGGADGVDLDAGENALGWVIEVPLSVSRDSGWIGRSQPRPVGKRRVLSQWRSLQPQGKGFGPVSDEG
jgi:hypothetical protein